MAYYYYVYYVRDSKKLWQMIKCNTNYNSRCTIESLGVNIDEQIDNINAFFTNVATDPDYDSDIIKNIVDSHNAIRASQVLDDISEYEIYVRLSQLKKLPQDPMTFLIGCIKNVPLSYLLS